MLPLNQFRPSETIQYVFTDIDDTLTEHGLLSSDTYAALWKLKQNKFKVIPVTGRPAGWCEMIARQWPVDGVIGENGAFYFRYHNQKMQRYFSVSEAERMTAQIQLATIREEILSRVPGAGVASDQFCRMMDLAIDFCEDRPPLSSEAVQNIVSIFEHHGATAKVSSIHVNGWFGEFSKGTTCLKFLEQEFQIDMDQAKKISCYCGDSPNDEPLFALFPNSFGVANVSDWQDQMEHLPRFVAASRGGQGFCEIAERLIEVTSG